MYMDGKGLMERTEQLNAELNRLVDAMWDSLGRAFVGLSAALIVPLLSWGPILLQGAVGEPPVTWHLIIAIVITAICLPGGIWLSLPWFKAARAIKRQLKIVKDHGSAIERETALCGEGRAES